MKKTTLLFILTLSSLVSISQTSFQTVLQRTTVGFPLSSGLIRSLSSTKSVIQVSSSGYTCFAVINDPADFQMDAAYLADNYSIRDFRLLRNLLFYCGSIDGHGVIGYFDLRNIMSGMSTTGHEIHFDGSSPTPMNSVNQLAVYEDPTTGQFRVAAIGEKNDHYMIEACLTSGGFTAFVRPCHNVHPKIERLTDVVVTDQYVAFVGIITNTGSVSLRRGYKTGIFSTPIIDTIYRYEYEHNGIPVAAAMESDCIAVATERVVTPEVDDEVQIRMYDISTMNMYQAQGMIVPYKGVINDLGYMSYDNSLLLLYEYNWSVPSFLYHVLYFSPANTSPYATSSVGAYDNRHYTNIDIHNSKYFLLGTDYYWMNHLKQAVSPVDNCINLLSHQVTPVDRMPCHKMTVRGTELKSYAVEVPVIYLNISDTIDCIH